MPRDRVLFDSPLIRIGHFVCPRGEGLWSMENVIGGTLVVFPSVPVLIHQAGHEPVLADRNVVMYYNDRQSYRRTAVHERGDDAVWIALKGDTGAALLAEFRADAAQRPEAPFEHSHGPSPARAYLRHQALADILARGASPSCLAVEEAAIGMVRSVLAAGARARGDRGPRAVKAETERDRRDVAERVRGLLAVDPGRAWTLGGIVANVHVSPGHLCRIFKRQVGMSIHQYLTQLRLREAAASVLDGERDLSTLGIRLGFSTHSHFTEAFRRTFGLAPSGLRDRRRLADIAIPDIAH
jgi:AraC-like DNA-binding protein